MLDFLKPRHLRYRSVEEWRERENITSFLHPGNPGKEAKLQRHLKELRDHLWKRHLKQLSREERNQLNAGTHPSLSHKGFEPAKPVFEEFRSLVASHPFVEEVTMVTQHMKPIIFRVKVARNATWRVWQEHIPPFYRGFEVMVSRAVNTKPALTRESAEKLIPNGMSEAQVYAHLGTNARVTHGKDTKSLTYLFHFPPPPPKVDPKVGSMTVFISNGVVVDRQFGE
ncbi:MAG TPA: hypothetical protein VH280_06655 [Verrucomicrobiae bacterium]|jgi:hypothetical protein|nr:hypothetical protein [Verrucomicrobiae bacterium]